MALIDGRKAEGVTDEDFRRWYNLPDAQQKKALDAMQVFKVAMYLAEKERTGGEAGAIAYAYATTRATGLRRPAPASRRASARTGRF